MYGLSFPVLHDNYGVYTQYGDGYIPYNVILDHDMVVRYSTSGFSENFIRLQIQNYISQIPTGIVQEPYDNLSPDKFNLIEVYPNPFNSTAKIRFFLEEAGIIELRLYDTMGKEVFTLIRSKYFEKGTHEISLDGARLSSGIYFAVLKTPAACLKTKFILLK